MQLAMQYKAIKALKTVVSRYHHQYIIFDNAVIKILHSLVSFIYDFLTQIKFIR